MFILVWVLDRHLYVEDGLASSDGLRVDARAVESGDKGSCCVLLVVSNHLRVHMMVAWPVEAWVRLRVSA